MRKTIPFGKYRGAYLTDIPTDYLEWAQSVAYEDLLVAIKEELLQRKNGRIEFVLLKTDMTMFKELVTQGYRTLAKKYHPDSGGKTTDMQKLNSLKEKLDGLI